MLALCLALALPASGCGEQGADAPDDLPTTGEGWTELFNGRDLDGWTPKIRGYPLGEDPLGTFRVEEGVLTVGYEGYDDVFAERFGHLFFAEPFERYELEIEYRFVGEQVADGPGWAVRNSGVMFHSQDPTTMGVDQDFPISIEAQFLGGDGTNDRPTHNLCTPGTHVVMDNVLVERHCVTAAAPTIHGDDWVTAGLIVDGAEVVIHTVGSDTVLTYSAPQVGGGNVDGHEPAVKIDGTLLGGGWIALQSESHPIQFRSVRIRPLEGLRGGARTPEAAGGSS